MNGTEDELRRVLGQFHVAILVTQTEDGNFRGRPMAIQQLDGDKSIWLATSDQSDKVGDVEREPTCAVVCHDGERSPTYVSMSGRAILVRDRAKIRQLWSPTWKLWFPEGPEEEDIVLLRFEPTHAEYANPQGGKLGVITAAMKRLITKEHPPKEDKVEVDLAEGRSS